jgi:hypothetical protein
VDWATAIVRLEPVTLVLASMKMPVMAPATVVPISQERPRMAAVATTIYSSGSRKLLRPSVRYIANIIQARSKRATASRVDDL